ncbi:hypothetical protein [Hyalangium versicolor]|uniref:hypothetical protein n=1 Tax=Hyalangium versicolor TaxID=2861190 RepID=UPI001CCD895D|nr:hypothetical protein [Hyalangium versicolor]
MATISSTRPPTSGEASSTVSGEAVGELPIADVADWGHLLPEARPEGESLAGAVPAVDSGAVLSEERFEAPAPAPSAEPPPLKGAGPSAAGFSIEVAERPELVSEANSEELTPLPSPRQGARPVAVESFPSDERSVASVVVDPAMLTALPSSRPAPGVNTPPPETPLPVLLLVEQAQNASGEERQELSRRINRWLDKMVSEGGSRHVADWFHHLIERGRLEGLADAAGQSCHETAVRGLLAMGFPYALEVRPEDLERLKPRQSQPKHRKRGRKLKGAAAGVLVGGLGAEVALDVLRQLPGMELLTVEVGLLLLALVTLLVSRPRSAAHNMGLAVLLVVSMLTLSLGVLGGYAGLAAGLGGLVAALLFALHRS